MLSDIPLSEKLGLPLAARSICVSSNRQPCTRATSSLAATSATSDWIMDAVPVRTARRSRLTNDRRRSTTAGTVPTPSSETVSTSMQMRPSTGSTWSMDPPS